jgi:ribosome-binding factor A
MRRVNEAVREVVSDAITLLKDPRVGFVTVTDVRTSPDLRHAKVFVSVLGSESERADTMDGLTSAHGVLQSMVNRELRLKRTPALEFVYDDTAARADRLERMLAEQERDA